MAEPARAGGGIHAARLASSPRLKRLREALGDGGWHSTWELMQATRNLAVGTSVSELRANGLDVACRTAKDEGGRTIYQYRLEG